MPPNTDILDTSTIVHENDDDKGKNNKLIVEAPRKYVIKWHYVIYFIYLPIAAMYGLYLGITAALWKTIVFTFIVYIFTAMSITAGVHRLWTHKAYKAKWPLQIFLMLCHSATNTHSSITWIKNHILHHKYCDTEADPHNSTRGFFFSHIGYLLIKKNAECKAKGKLLDLSELYANPVLRFQKKNHAWLTPSLTFIIPSLVPLLWGEQFTVAYHINILRVAMVVNDAFMVNSIAHLYGTKPYDKSIRPTQNKLVSFFAFGEGFHNYHHVFPHDYRTAELGDNYLNPTTKFIDFCAWIGQAYDRRYVTDEMIEARKRRTGEKY